MYLPVIFISCNSEHSGEFRCNNKLILGHNDSNITFAELIKILKLLGFKLRIKGSHHILYKDGLLEIINLQSKENGKAKEY